MVTHTKRYSTKRIRRKMGVFSVIICIFAINYSQARMVLEKSATLLFVWLTPLGVKLCSQVCGELGSTHAWISVFLDFTTEHAVGVRIVLRCGTHH